MATWGSRRIGGHERLQIARNNLMIVFAIASVLSRSSVVSLSVRIIVEPDVQRNSGKVRSEVRSDRVWCRLGHGSERGPVTVGRTSTNSVVTVFGACNSEKLGPTPWSRVRASKRTRNPTLDRNMFHKPLSSASPAMG